MGLILGIPFLMLSYGLLFLLSFYLLIIILDFILFSITNKILVIMIIEWMLIAPPFIYWGFKYNYWAWFVLLIAFITTQYIRGVKIMK